MSVLSLRAIQNSFWGTRHPERSETWSWLCIRPGSLVGYINEYRGAILMTARDNQDDNFLSGRFWSFRPEIALDPVAADEDVRRSGKLAACAVEDANVLEHR